MSIKHLACHILPLVTLSLGEIPNPCGTPVDLCHAPIKNHRENYVKADACVDIRTHADWRSEYPKGCQAEIILTTDPGYRFACEVRSFELAPGGSLLFDGGAIQTCLAGATCPKAVLSPHRHISLAFDGGSDQGQGFNVRCRAVASPCGQCAPKQIEEEAPYVFDSAAISLGCECNLRVTTKPGWSVQMVVEEQANTQGARQSLRGLCQGPMALNGSLPKEVQDKELYLSVTAPQRAQKAPHYRIRFTAVEEKAECATTTPTSTTSSTNTKSDSTSRKATTTTTAVTSQTLAPATDTPSTPASSSGTPFRSTSETSAKPVTVPLQLSDIPIAWIVVVALFLVIVGMCGCLFGRCYKKRRSSKPKSTAPPRPAQPQAPQVRFHPNPEPTNPAPDSVSQASSNSSVTILIDPIRNRCDHHDPSSTAATHHLQPVHVSLGPSSDDDQSAEVRQRCAECALRNARPGPKRPHPGINPGSPPHESSDEESQAPDEHRDAPRQSGND